MIGRIILARWLRFPPRRYESAAAAVTDSLIYYQMAHRIEVVPFPATLVQPETSGNTRGREAVARLILDEAGFSVAYRHPVWGREFHVDGVAPLSGDPADPDLDWLLRRLRLINTRNRLTHLILLSTAEAQAAYLRSGEPAQLEPLPQSTLFHRIATCSRLMQQFLPPGSKLETVDASMISRGVRDLTVCTPQGQPLPLRHLLASKHTVLRTRLRVLLDDEAVELKRGEVERPRTDDQLRQQIEARWSQRASRRTIAAARQALGIPANYRRAGRPNYPPAAIHLSSSHLLTAAGVRAHAPARSGVYEIALSGEALAYPFRASPVVYIGRSQHLSDRLRAHLYNHEKFGSALGEGRLVFRHAAVSPTRLREAETEMLRTFCEAHGALPCHNTVMPSNPR